MEKLFRILQHLTLILYDERGVRFTNGKYSFNASFKYRRYISIDRSPTCCFIISSLYNRIFLLIGNYVAKKVNDQAAPDDMSLVLLLDDR